MQLAENRGSRANFGPFCFDLRTAELSKHGRRIRISGQAALVLTVLLERHGELVSREELKRELWPQETFVDFDHGLNNAINRIREVLGDKASAARYVETLPKRGYRLIGEVQFLREQTVAEREHPRLAMVAGGETQAAAAREPLSTRVHFGSKLLSAYRHGGVWLAIAAIAFAIACGLLYGASRPAILTERQLTATSLEARVTGASLSPDGRYLAYSDVDHVFLQEFANNEVHTLDLPRGVRFRPSGWFPDSTHLLLVERDFRDTADLWKVSILGGPPKKIMQDAFAASVSPDGSRIACLRHLVALSSAISSDMVVGAEIWYMNADGSAGRRLMPVPPKTPEGNYGAPAWSPDGRSLAYLVNTVPPHRATLMVHEIGQELPRAVLGFPLWQSATAWTSDGDLLYPISNPARLGSTIWSVHVGQSGVGSGVPQEISTGAGTTLAITATADSKHVAVLRSWSQAQTYVAEWSPDHSQLTAARRLTQDRRASRPYDWTADSRAVLFWSNRDGIGSIYKQDVDQPTAELVVSNAHDKVPPRMSPDGNHVFYLSGEEGGGDIFMRVPLNGGRAEQVLKADGSLDFQCSRAPARRCVIVKRQGSDVLVFDEFDPDTFVTRELVRTTVNVVVNCAISQDGSQVAIASSENGRAVVRFLPLDGSRARDVIVKNGDQIKSLDWGADGRSLVAAGAASNGDSVVLDIDLDGNAREILRADKSAVINRAFPSPDGRYVAIRQTIGENNVSMVERR